MGSLLQSPPPDASSSIRGLINTATQAFAGVKTFVNGLIASAAVTINATLTSSSTATGSTDVVVKVGTSTADASVDPAARLFSARSNIGGTESEHVWVSRATGVNAGVLNVDAGGRSNVRHLVLSSGGSGRCGIIMTPSAGGQLEIGGTGGTSNMAFKATNLAIDIESSANSFDASVYGVRLAVSSNPSPGSRRVVQIDNEAIGTGAAGMLQCAAAGVSVLEVAREGRIDQYGTDSTASPGAAVINKPVGKSAIAAGASSVVITNSLVAAGDRVHITPHARDGTCKELIAVAAAGSFTVSGTANATAALPFSWSVGRNL